MKATEHKETGEKMHVYEVGYLVVPSLAENKLAEEVSAIRGLIEAAQGEIIAEDFPKLRPLAYTMERATETKKQKFTEGYFGWIKFELPVSAIKNITQDFDKRSSIIRHLIIKTVRENTLYTTKLAGAAAKDSETGKVLDGASAETPATVVEADGKAASRKEIDKTIDALVIS